MSLRESIDSVLNIAFRHSILFNALSIVESYNARKYSPLMPEFYGTVTVPLPTSDAFLEYLDSCDREKHIVTRVNIFADGQRTYYLKTGLITLQDKLVCSFLGWPITLLEALIYLVAIPFALSGIVLLALICITGAIPLLLSASRATITAVKENLATIACIFLIMVPLGLVMVPYRLFQAIFRIPVGIVLLVKAGIDKLLGLEEETPRTIQALNLTDKTAEEIRNLGIEVQEIRNDDQRDQYANFDPNFDPNFEYNFEYNFNSNEPNSNSKVVVAYESIFSKCIYSYYSY